MSAPVVELDVDPVWGQDTDWDALAARAAAAAAHVAPELAHDNLLVSLVLGDDGEVRDLNRQWRAKDAPTNVLSFPMLSREEVLHAGGDEGVSGMLGDVILAHGVCAAEAESKRLALADHAAHLIVHGLLHLAGHAHEEGDDAAERMEMLEIEALKTLGIANPYCTAT
ncbi:MAG: rRNA maturation RNase YbeY [Novosphingobium sp.]